MEIKAGHFVGFEPVNP